MSFSAAKLTNYLKNYWADLLPPFSAHGPNEVARPFADRDTVIQTGVLYPAVLAKHLRGNSLYDANEEAVKEIEVRRVLKHHVGKRCTLEVALRTERGWQLLIAKVYRKDRSDVFEAMKGIQRVGFGPQDEYSISQPVGFAPSLRCLLQEKVQGTPADEIFKTGDEPARVAAAERCARWLARFHALAPKAGPVSHPKEFIHSKAMQRWSHKIAKLEGAFGQKAAHLLHRLENASASLSDVELKAGHGSYNAAHVYLSKDRTVTIDWDWHDVADPARDVARFLYALRRWALDQLGSIRALDRAAEVFLKTYLAEGSPEVEKNLHFFEATTCLNLAVRHLFDEGPSWEEKQQKAETMLDEGLNIVEGAVTPR
jgi:Phosphotransferase enzyme family